MPALTALLIDAGNTRVKFGLRRERDYSASPAPRETMQTAFSYDEAEAIAAWLDRVLGEEGVTQGSTRALDGHVVAPSGVTATPGGVTAAPSGVTAAPSGVTAAPGGAAPAFSAVLGSNVAGPAVQRMLDDLLAARGAVIQWQAATASRLGLVNGYREPTRLGPDRWLGMVGIWACAQRAAFLTTAPLPTEHLLAHFGTATTLDTIDATGHFVGGMILPGRDMMRRSLATGTANLPAAEGHIQPFPGDTHDAIASGVAAAQAGAVARQWLAVRDRYGRPPLLHVSGGAWLSIATEVQHLLGAIGSTQIIRVVDNPVLDGLACVAEADAHSPSSHRS
ncbi:type III pantothenate kinase [Pigmentiphaga litoralis]|uniref:type III pantothenate kinase n=1 Tax=Pigmentiphaga litoralis TaxID=516702 RepID=UPI003B42D0E6